jgi:signal transduction histidine kinase
MSLAIVREVSRRLRENDEMAIGDLRLKARELAQAYQQLAELEFARREFLTSIAHELRTPLMSANGFMQVIRLGMLEGDTLKAALEAIERSLQEITTLSNDILFLQEMDLILPEFKPVDLGVLLPEVITRQEAHARQNKVVIKLEIAADLPTMPGDSQSLGRAFSAILDNAIKFSPNGGEVKVQVGYDTGVIWIRITDHGVGIPAEVLPRIFDRFFHIDSMGAYLFRGLGLGLSIARQVIEQHNGRIEVQSTPWKGSAFTVWITRLI